MAPFVSTDFIVRCIRVWHNPVAHFQNLSYSWLPAEVILVLRQISYTLPRWVVTSFVGPIQAHFWADHKHHELPGSVLVALRSGLRNHDVSTTDVGVEVLAIHTARNPGNTNLEVAVFNISVVERTCMDNAKGSAIPEELAHVARRGCSIGIVGITFVDPLFDLICDIHRHFFV